MEKEADKGTHIEGAGDRRKRFSLTEIRGGHNLCIDTVGGWHCFVISAADLDELEELVKRGSDGRRHTG